MKSNIICDLRPTHRIFLFRTPKAELKRQNQMKAEAIRREQNERRAKEEAAVRQRNADQKREEQAQATRIKARREAAEKEVSHSIFCLILLFRLLILTLYYQI